MLHPIYATAFGWATLIARLRLGETIRWPNLVGVVLLAIGIFLIAIRPQAAAG